MYKEKCGFLLHIACNFEYILDLLIMKYINLVSEYEPMFNMQNREILFYNLINIIAR